MGKENKNNSFFCKNKEEKCSYVRSVGLKKKENSVMLIKTPPVNYKLHAGKARSYKPQNDHE